VLGARIAPKESPWDNELLIKRNCQRPGLTGYDVKIMGLNSNKCLKCDEEVKGIYENPGDS
jgi:hypothetical protein